MTAPLICMLEKFTLKRDVSKSKLNSAAQVEYLISYPTVKDWKIVKHMKLNCRAQVMSKLQFDSLILPLQLFALYEKYGTLEFFKICNLLFFIWLQYAFIEIQIKFRCPDSRWTWKLLFPPAMKYIYVTKSFYALYVGIYFNYFNHMTFILCIWVNI